MKKPGVTIPYYRHISKTYTGAAWGSRGVLFASLTFADLPPGYVLAGLVKD